MEAILKQYNPEFAFGFLFYIVVLGTGLWFYRSFWPWLSKYLEKKTDLIHQRELIEIEANAEAEKRWHNISERMVQALIEVKEEMTTFRITSSKCFDMQRTFIARIMPDE